MVHRSIACITLQRYLYFLTLISPWGSAVVKCLVPLITPIFADPPDCRHPPRTYARDGQPSVLVPGTAAVRQSMKPPVESSR